MTAQTKSGIPNREKPNRYWQKGGGSMTYVCDVCGYVYDETQGDPDNGIAPGTTWDELPADFECPLCHVGKDQFSPQ